MLTLTLTLLLALAALLLVLRRPRAGLGLLVGALALFWVAGNGLLTGLLLEPLQRPYPRLTTPQWGRRNAVVLLGAGAVKPPGLEGFQPSLMAMPRILEAVRLYRNCVTSGRPCTLIISGGDALKIGASEAAIYRQEALGLGVPDRDLVVEDKSMNTFKNAEYCNRILTAGAFDRVLLVTSGFHLERSLLYFAHFGIHAQGAAADHLMATRSWMPQAYNVVLAEVAVHEHLGILRYRFYNAMGWNVKVPGQAGAV